MAGRLIQAMRRLWHSPTVTTWGSLLVRLSAVLVVMPVVLVRFSPADVALWQLFSAVFVLALMLDFGLSPTLARMIAYASGGASLADMASMRRMTPDTAPATPNHDAAVAVLSTLRWLYPRAALGLTLLLALLGTWGMAKPVSQASDVASAWVAWVLVLASTGVSLWGGAYAAALQGFDRIAAMRRWEALTGLCQIACSVAALALGGNLLWLVAVYQGWAVLAAVRNRLLLRGLHPELFIQAPARDPEVLRVLWPGAWRSGLGVLMSQGIIQASGIIYSQLAPAAEVAAYLLALRLMQMLSQFSQAPFYGKLPQLARMHAAGRHQDELVLAQRGMRLAHFVLALGAVTIALAAQPLMHAIGSRTAFVPPGVWALIALAFFAERYGAMHMQLYSLTNHIVWHVANGVTGALMIGLAIAGYPRLGAYAFPAAMLAAYLGFYCIYAVRLSSRTFKIDLLRFELKTAVPSLLLLLTGLSLASSLPWAGH